MPTILNNENKEINEMIDEITKELTKVMNEEKELPEEIDEETDEEVPKTTFEITPSESTFEITPEATITPSLESTLTITPEAPLEPTLTVIPEAPFVETPEAIMTREEFSNYANFKSSDKILNKKLNCNTCKRETFQNNDKSITGTCKDPFENLPGYEYGEYSSL